MPPQVRIEGLADFRRDLRRINPELNKGVREALKRAVEPVASEARAKAPKRSGRLASSIKPFTKGNVAGVAVTARDRRTGYRYPRRIEFADGGRRAFLAPAVERKAPEVERALEGLLDDIARTWSGG